MATKCKIDTPHSKTHQTYSTCHKPRSGDWRASRRWQPLNPPSLVIKQLVTFCKIFSRSMAAMTKTLLIVVAYAISPPPPSQKKNRGRNDKVYTFTRGPNTMGVDMSPLYPKLKAPIASLSNLFPKSFKRKFHFWTPVQNSRLQHCLQ